MLEKAKTEYEEDRENPNLDINRKYCKDVDKMIEGMLRGLEKQDRDEKWFNYYNFYNVKCKDKETCFDCLYRLEHIVLEQKSC